MIRPMKRPRKMDYMVAGSGQDGDMSISQYMTVSGERDETPFFTLVCSKVYTAT